MSYEAVDYAPGPGNYHVPGLDSKMSVESSIKTSRSSSIGKSERTPDWAHSYRIINN